MRIFGIGADIVKIKRLKKLISNKSSLLKLFNQDETKMQ